MKMAYWSPSLAKVVWPGRAFLRQFIDLLCCSCNKEFCRDLQWWQQFLSYWHGAGFWLSPQMQLVRLALVPILEGSGFTAQAEQSIVHRELFPVVIAAHLWGFLWARKHDLLLSAARWCFTFTAAHVP